MDAVFYFFLFLTLSSPAPTFFTCPTLEETTNMSLEKQLKASFCRENDAYYQFEKSKGKYNILYSEYQRTCTPLIRRYQSELMDRKKAYFENKKIKKILSDIITICKPQKTKLEAEKKKYTRLGLKAMFEHNLAIHLSEMTEENKTIESD